jgi:membrane protein YqaA with SNARE-associated domain
MTQTAPPPAVNTAVKKPVTWWHYHRRLYDWMLTFSHKPSATAALFFFSIIEAIFFPIPPFVLQIPMTLERRERAWWYATVCTFGSVLGGAGGYAIGMWSQRIVHMFFESAELHQLDRYTSNTALLTLAAIAIHPYKLFTIAAGFLHVPIPAFFTASIVGRGVIFYGIAALLWLFGEPVRRFIDRYFHVLTVVFAVLLIAIVVLFKKSF